MSEIPRVCAGCGRNLGLLGGYIGKGHGELLCAGCHSPAEFDGISKILNIGDLEERRNNVNGAEFVFTKYMPDIDDLHAESRCAKAYFENPQPPLEDIEYFMAGFTRGIAWAKAKYGIK